MANYVSNPRAETDTTGWSTGSNRTITRVTELPAPHPDGVTTGFQAASTAAMSGAFNAAQTSVSVPVAGTYEHRWWVYVPSSWTGGGIDANTINFTGLAGTANALVNMNIRDEWQEVVVPNLEISASDLSGSIQLRSRTQWNAGESFYFTDVSFGEPAPAPTPRIFPVLKPGPRPITILTPH